MGWISKINWGMHSIRALFRASIDYAGLFPPAELDMPAAVRNYAEYRSGAQAWALGRFIVPVSRLDELERAAAANGFGPTSTVPWALSVLVGGDIVQDLKRIGEFNRQHGPDGTGTMLADALELKATSATAIEAALSAVPTAFQTYVEIPIDRDPVDLLATIARLGGRAKVRTGGVTSDAFPAAADLARFVRRCEEARVPFKATAGLHHPLRAEYRLTYAPDSAHATMYGFANLFLAASLAFAGMTDDDAAALLDERDAAAFRLDDHGIEWRGHRLGLDAIANARERAIIAFGSCSFTEPIDDLTALGWI